MADQIKSELKDASDYIKCAIEYKVSDPELSSLYYKLSKAEEEHMLLLHKASETEIEKAKSENKISDDIMAVMSKLWEYEHDMILEKYDKLKKKYSKYEMM